MTKPGGIETKIEPGVIARAIAGFKFVVTGNADWFGPGAPQDATAPKEIEGRQYSMPISVNSMVQTKTEGLTFHNLRLFAERCDIVRLLIETRKDQICGLGWSIKPIEQEKERIPVGGPSKPKVDPRVVDLTKFLSRPDKEHNWSEWLRMLLEDMFVIDAPCCYIQRTNGGTIYALRPIDGATIKRIVDTRGWTPMAPAPAYQQVLHGTTALSYTTEQMVYRPRNPRTNKMYGYSPVEQIIVTMRLWLDRQASNIEYYETGNMPEGFIQAPLGWGPDQLRAFQDILDAQLSGNLAERRKVRAVPHGSTYQAGKEPALKGDYDEWLARIACFAFSYPPTAFTKLQNRANGETAKQSADEEGLQPVTKWVKGFIDGIIQDHLGFADLEFVFEDKEAQDPMQRAQIDDIKIKNGSLLVDEARADDGREPLPEPQTEEPEISTTEVTEDGTTTPAKPGQPAAAKPVAGKGAKVPAKGKAAPAKKHVHAPAQGGLFKARAEDGAAPIDRGRAMINSAKAKVGDELTASLASAADEAATQITAAIDAGLTTAGGNIVVDQIALTSLGDASGTLMTALTAVATDGTDQAMLQLNVGGADLTSLVHTQAVDWAKRRAADLITSDGTGGELLDATRDLIRGTVEKALNEGWSSTTLAKELRDSYAFSPARAATIARTEVAFADSFGNLTTYIASGVVKAKKWLLASEACAVCQANADEGAIPLVQAFKSGDMCTPAHPHCECDIEPIV